MGDLEDKLESILNNSQAMEQIISLAQTLGEKNAASPSVPVEPTPHTGEPGFDPEMLKNIMSLLSQYNSNDDQRTALLSALRPFVKEKRYARIDKAIQIAKMSHVIRSALEFVREKE